MSAVQFLQKGVVRAFGEAALLIDKSQHAQLLKGRQRRKEGETQRGHDGTSHNLIGTHLAAFIVTKHPGNGEESIEFSVIYRQTSLVMVFDISDLLYTKSHTRKKATM